MLFDSDDEFELISSQENRPKFSVCPEETNFKVMIKDGSSIIRFRCVLRKGISLPCKKEYLGKLFRSKIVCFKGIAR